jgi:hypothetical protein
MIDDRHRSINVSSAMQGHKNEVYYFMKPSSKIIEKAFRIHSSYFTLEEQAFIIHECEILKSVYISGIYEETVSKEIII